MLKTKDHFRRSFAQFITDKSTIIYKLAVTTIYTIWFKMINAYQSVRDKKGTDMITNCGQWPTTPFKIRVEVINQV